MESTASSTLLKFVEQVSESTNREVGQLTICDLMVGVREERMAEIGSWTNRDLDLIESHASLFSYSDPVENALNGSPAGETNGFARVCTPSPVAWF